MEADTYKQEMEDKALDYERDIHWRMIFENNQGGTDDEKYLLNNNR